METCDFQVPAKPKPFERSICNIARWITLAKLRDVSKMVEIGWLGVTSQIGEKQPKKLSLLYFTLPHLFFLYDYTAQTA
jgi:hypothetical protein